MERALSIQQQSLLPDEEPREQQDFGHAEELRAFEFALRDLPWADVYAGMLAAGFKWREAAYVAWAVQTKENRQPKTGMELAKLLGCNKNKISQMAGDPRLQAMKFKFVNIAYLDSLPDIIQASIDVASKPTYKSTPERNNILNKILALGTDTLNLHLTDSDKTDMSELSPEQLAAAIAAEDAE